MEKQPSLIGGLLRKYYIKSLMAALCIFLGTIVMLLNQRLTDYIFKPLFILHPRSPLVNMWTKPPMSYPTDFYYFNWTNPEEFYNHNVKPKMQQLGPYRFMLTVEKENVIWNDNNTVTYAPIRYWHCRQDEAIGNLSDLITTINVLPLAALKLTKNWSLFFKRLLDAVTSVELNITKTINELACEGYEDTLMDIIQYIPFISRTLARMGKVSPMRMINGSSMFEGVFNIGIGLDGDYDIYKWNYESISPMYSGNCAKVHGSGGEIFSTNKLQKDSVGFFSGIVGRYLPFDFETEVIVDGLTGYKYITGDGLYDNGTKVPGNSCYCNGPCFPSGVIDASSSVFKLPFFVSAPNFYGADPIYLNELEGLKPDKNSHQGYIVIEPNTGFILDAALRVQFNVLIEPIEGLSLFENSPRIVFPLLWIDQKAAMPSLLTTILRVYFYSPYILLGIGCCLIIAGILLWYIVLKPVLIKFLKNICINEQFGDFIPEEIGLCSEKPK